MSAGLQLGPFVLQRRLGRGAMGEVWGAVHTRAREMVAVKLLTAEAARERRFVDALLRETEVVASLSHPNIVRVHDVGILPADAGASAGGPYLVMEAATGTLADEVATLQWDRLRLALEATLNALAHAHARGVVHRDVKPANVLVGAGESSVDDPLGLRLADFGIAGASSRRERSAGTPSYMPPEQARGGLCGPWSDLYALGITAWQLASGRLPFGDDTVYRVLRRHAEEAPPAFAPAMDVPAGFEDWLLGLLAKAPEDRPQRAAEALAALQALGPAEPLSARPLPPVDAPDAPTSTFVWDVAPVSPASSAASTAVRWPLPDLPERWAAPRRPWRAPLPETGLGVVALRELPLIGRASQQDALWEHFRSVAGGAGARRVDLVGPEGAGRGPLAAWLAVRAHEVGHAHVLRATDGIREGLVAWAGGVSGFTEHALSVGVPEWIAEGLETSLRGSGSPPLPLVMAFIEALSAGPRAVVVIADGPSAELDGLVQRAPPGLRLLVLCPANSASGAHSVSVSPLSELDMDVLLRDTLALEASAADAIARRSGGLPIAAVELIRDLADTGVLVSTPSGFVVAAGGELSLPPSERIQLEERLARVGGGAALERLAVLDAPASAAQVGLVPVREAVRAGLVREASGLLVLASAGLRTLLLERATDAGRLAAHHRWAAEQSTDPIEQGAHRLAAGETGTVIAALLAAGRERLSRRDTRAALRAADLLLAAPADALTPMQRLEVAALRGGAALHRGDAAQALAALEAVAEADWPDPDRHIQIVSGYANTLRLVGRMDEALTWMDRAVAMLEAHPAANTTSRRHVAMNRAVLSLRRGSTDGPQRVLEAVDAARADSSSGHVQDALNLLAWVRVEQGDVSGALEASASALAEGGASDASRADRLQDRASFLLLSERLDDARECVQESLVLARRAASARSVSGAYARLGSLEVVAQNPDRALIHLDEALQWARRVGQVPMEWELQRVRALGQLGRVDEGHAAVARIHASPQASTLAVPAAVEELLLIARVQNEAEVCDRVAALGEAAAAAGLLRHPALRAALTEVAGVSDARGLPEAAAAARALAG
ncbi:MAG: tetratricopeptide (TPR) repeat protein [Myxococcota bacterium]|jgi:tetratricopeptide (TPR) repeat protein